MDPITIYLGALGLFGLGAFFTRKTPRGLRLGGAKYERRRKRKILGVILLIAAVLLLVLGVLTQFTSSFS
jgi:cell division septal protein FtsQ